VIGEHSLAPFVVTIGETMVALATTVPGDVEGLAGWDQLEEFALHPEGAVQR
jgi:hypothetical protein